MKVESIRLEGVTRRFGRHLAVRNVSLSLASGQLTLLLGPNGAGKTTLMRMLASTLEPTRGELLVDCTEGGESFSVTYHELRKNAADSIGLVSHASLLYEDLSGVENLMLFAQLYGMTRTRATERTEELLAQVGLEEAATRRVGTYSRGMRQRLSIARAVLQDPPIILLDEPYTGLDQDSASELNTFLAGLKARSRVLVLITHRLAMPSSLVDRAILLKAGKVVADGPPGANIGTWYEDRLREGAA